MKNDLLKIFIPAIIILAAIFLIKKFVNINDIKHFMEFNVLHKSGDVTLKNVELFLIYSSFLILIGIPRLWISAVAGSVFGVYYGTIYALLATLIGVSVLYVLGRYFNLGADKILKGKFKDLAVKLKEHSFFGVLYLRLFPFSNNTIATLLCGICKVKFIPFIIASALGFLPLTVTFNLIGDGGMKNNYFNIFLGFVCMILVFVLQIIFKKLNLFSNKNNASHTV